MDLDNSYTAWITTNRALLGSDYADLAVIGDESNTIMFYTVLPVRHNATPDAIAAAVDDALTEAGWEIAGPAHDVDSGEVIPVRFID